MRQITPRRAVAALAITTALVTVAAAVMASESETYTLGDSSVTVHAHEFLTPEELDTLRLVGNDPQALALFMGDGPGHGAIAVAPAQGFIRDGMPAQGVAALAQLPDAETARNAALSMCEQERSTGPSCVIVLELAPAN